MSVRSASDLEGVGRHGGGDMNRMARAFALASSVAAGVLFVKLARPDVPGRAAPAPTFQRAPVPAPAAPNALVPAAPAPAAPAAPVGPAVSLPSTPPRSAATSVSMGTNFNAPIHGPAQLDFGEVWNGQSTTRTFHLTTNASGYVTVTIPPPYRVSQFRELGPIVAPSKNNPSHGLQPIVPTQPVKTRLNYPPGSTGPWQWSLASGVDIQIDLVFEPKFDMATMNAGPKPASMKVTGPGPKGNWTLNIPVAGIFNGLVLAPIVLLQQKDFVVPTRAPVQAFESVQLPIRLVGTGDAVTGRIVWPSLSNGLVGSPTNVNLGPSQTL